MATIEQLYGMPKRKSLSPLDLLYGAVEMGANLGTGALAQLGGGLTYLPAAAMGGDDAGQAVMRAVQQAYTYQPRGDAAQQIGGAIGNLVAPIAKSASVGAQTFANNVYDATGSPLMGAAARTAPAAIDLLADRLRLGKLAGPVKQDITAYHGTPHDFDQFDISKIGTGEGAQAYGHGLYFADSTDVAKGYASGLSEIDFSGADTNAMIKALEPMKYRRDDVFDLVNSASDPSIPQSQIKSMAVQVLNDMKNDPEQLDSALRIAKNAGAKTGGKLYTVDIPDEHVAKMLDWDKQLSEQPAAVQDALRRIRDSAAKSFPHIKGNDNMTGQGIYEAYKAHRGGNQKAASDALIDNGIPGIRYLDQGSRGAGKGTKNTVVFDDKLVKVLRKE